MSKMKYYNGSAWVALDAANADTVGGLTVGQIQAGVLAKGQVSTDNTGWVASGNTELPQKKNVAIASVTTADKAIVDFTLATLAIATEAGITYQETYDGGVTLFAANAPSGTVTFDYAIIKG